MRNSIMKLRVKAYTILKTFFAVVICLALTAGCAAAPLISGGPETPENTKARDLTPIPETASPAAGQSPEGNITAYEELTPAVMAVLDFLGDYRHFPYGVAAYQQTAFEDGTLVLAAGLNDGENSTELFFVDAENKVECYTSGSYCWLLNFTDFRNKRIFYGLAGREAQPSTPPERQNVKEVSVEFENSRISAVPYQEDAVIAVKNPQDSLEKIYGEAAQGYIIVCDQKEMPNSLNMILEDGTTVSSSDMILAIETIPKYLNVKNAGVRSSYAFQYNPMFTEEIRRLYSEKGQPMLESGDNREALRGSGVFGKTSPDDLFRALSVFANSNNSFSGSFPLYEEVKLIPGEGFNKDAKIKCYFYELTSEMWDKFYTTGTVSWTFREPDKDGNIELFDKKGYYFIVMYVDDPAITSGVLTYTGVISLD